MPVTEAESLWIMALKFFANQKKYFEKMIDLSLNSVAKYGGSENGFSLSSAVVNFIPQKDGLQHAREVYKRFLALPHPGLALYRHCIELESNLASFGSENSLINCMKLHLQLMTKKLAYGKITIPRRLRNCCCCLLACFEDTQGLCCSFYFPGSVIISVYVTQLQF